jgi:cyclase
MIKKKEIGMKKNALLLSVILILWSSQALGQQEELSIHPVTGSVYVITGAGSNVVFYVTEEEIVVADSGEKPDMAEKILEKIRDVSDKPVRFLVFTHYHHTIGAADFPPSVVTISHKNTRGNISLSKKILLELFEGTIKELKQKAVQWKDKKGPELEKVRVELELRKKQMETIQQEKVVLPHITFENKIEILLSGQRVVLLYLGQGHTNGDILVHFPEEKVLYVSDLLFTNGWVPRLDGDAGASVDGWLRIFEGVAEMDVDKIIPGHGEVVDKEGFIKVSEVFSEYLTDLKTEVKRYIERGTSLEEIKDELRLLKYQHMGMAEILLPWNIEGVYRELKSHDIKE